MDHLQRTLCLLALGFLSCFSNVQGLKCYVCHMGSSSCVSVAWSFPGKYLEEKNRHLVECDLRAISCASLSVATKDPYSVSGYDEEWFQRICLYPGDLSCIGMNPQDFETYLSPQTANSIFFPDWESCINLYRKQNSIPEIPQLPSDSYIQIRGRTISFGFHSCKNISDACNDWRGSGRSKTPINLAEGFPMDMHEQRKKGYKTNCYRCDYKYTQEGTPKYCEDHYKKHNDKTYASVDAYGCYMLAIYQIAGGMENHHYFQRGLWFPGDQWCLEKSYNSTSNGTGRSLGGARNANIRYLKRSNLDSCTKDDYSRALKGRELSSKYEWIGQMEFYSVEEFSNYINCRKHVTNKLVIKANRVEVPFNHSAAAAAWSGRSGVFASVGFRFCGPESFCNDWTEHELYEQMVNPPMTSTTLAPDVTTSTTTTKPTTTPPPREPGDGCFLEPNRNTSPKMIPSLSNAILFTAFLQAGVIIQLI